MKKQTGLNPTQLYLLRLFAQNDSEKSLNELKEVLVEYYLKHRTAGNAENDVEDNSSGSAG